MGRDEQEIEKDVKVQDKNTETKNRRKEGGRGISEKKIIQKSTSKTNVK